MEKATTSVEIPADLYNKIEEKITHSDVSSVADFIIKVIEDKLSSDQEKSESLSSEDEERVKERLKALGYMD